MDELLGIGDFASLCGLSPKMLRSYARVGLLVPAAVDGSSGYRYYAAAQLPQARVVALLRQAEVGIEEIAAFFARPHPEHLDRWERALDGEASSRRRALADARRALAMAPRGPTAWEPLPKETPMTVRFTSGMATDRGRRESNEDSVLVSKDLWAIADGVGGLGNGDVASRRALDVLDEGFGRDHSAAGLLGACHRANQVVWTEGARHSPGTAMGTTLLALAVTSDVGTVVVHAGDSRLYRLRNGQLVRLTKDHTVAADLVEAGELRAEDARTHPHRRVLTRAIGVGETVQVDLAGVSCRPGDRFLLCTDGLFQLLDHATLREALHSEAEPHAAAERLVTTAAQRVAEDNVTALVVGVDSQGQGD